MINDTRKQIIVLYGGFGEERSVSIDSGKAVASSLKKDRSLLVHSLCIDNDIIPNWLDSNKHIVFPMIHGAFGENGDLQRILSSRGIEYAGSNFLASSLCFNKLETKLVVASLGFSTANFIDFSSSCIPPADRVIKTLGESLVIKPKSSGSSYGLKMIEGRSSLGLALSQIDTGEWLIEKRLYGRELSVGILDNKVLEIIEIKHERDLYDYDAKYNSQCTEYICPAILNDNIRSQLIEESEKIMEACGCRDFARIDFILVGEIPYFLEVNTIPGMSSHSLLPKCALASGISFDELTQKMLSFAIERSLI